MQAKVWFVGAGPGNPDLITVKGLSLLRDADVLIYAGSLVNPVLIEKSGAATKLDSWGMHLDELVAAMEMPAKSGKTVVRLHSGDPSLYGAIVEQIEELERRGIAVEIVPGVSSLFAAAAALGTQLTLRGVSETLIVTRPAGKTLTHDQIADSPHSVLPWSSFSALRNSGRSQKNLPVPRIHRQQLSITLHGLTRKLCGEPWQISHKRRRMTGSNTQHS